MARRPTRRFLHTCQHCGREWMSTQPGSRWCMEHRPQALAAAERGRQREVARAERAQARLAALLAAQRERYERERAARVVVACRHCGQPGERKRRGAIYCSARCGELAFKRRSRHTPHRGSGWSARRERIAHAFRWTCMLCLRPIPRERAFPHPDSVTLDHVVPRARGGRDTRRNLWPAHLGCNMKRGDGPVPRWSTEQVAGLPALDRLIIVATMLDVGAVPAIWSDRHA